MFTYTYIHIYTCMYIYIWLLYERFRMVIQVPMKPCLNVLPLAPARVGLRPLGENDGGKLGYFRRSRLSGHFLHHHRHVELTGSRGCDPPVAHVLLRLKWPKRPTYSGLWAQHPQKMSP